MNIHQKRLTEMAHGGGCGCKLAPAVLQDILKKMPLPIPCADLLVGTETADDAAVYRLNATQAIIATTDFFTPIVDDPFDFGRIAATNALSDVYAMGGRPLFALALVGMPIATIPIEMAQDILAGGAAVCAEAGIPVVGGHSIDTPEPIYGLVAVGLIHPDKVLKNSNAKAGDTLILTKALGVGIFSAAMKKGELDAAGYAAMVASATKLNTVGADLSDLPEVHAMTDVTGFGLLGHLLEMCRGAGLAARLTARPSRSCPAPRPSPRRATRPARRRATGKATAAASTCRRVWRTGDAACSATRRRAAGCWWPSRRTRPTRSCNAAMPPGSRTRPSSARWRRAPRP